MNKTQRIPTLGAERRKLRGGRCWTLSDWNLNATNLIVSRPMEDDFEVRRINVGRGDSLVEAFRTILVL